MARPRWTTGPAIEQLTDPRILRAQNGAAITDDAVATEYAFRFHIGPAVVRDWLRATTASRPGGRGDPVQRTPGLTNTHLFAIPPLVTDTVAVEYVRPDHDPAATYTVDVLPGVWSNYDYGEARQGWVLEWALRPDDVTPDIRSASVNVAALDGLAPIRVWTPPTQQQLTEVLAEVEAARAQWFASTAYAERARKPTYPRMHVGLMQSHLDVAIQRLHALRGDT